MNARKGIVISENENGFMPQHVMQNSNYSEKTRNVLERSAADKLKEFLTERVRESTDRNNQKGEGSSSKDPSPLGLKLAITPSLQCDIGKRIRWPQEEQPRQENESLRSRLANRHYKTKSVELPAANFPALGLRIGAWQRVARHEGDLVVKLFYNRQKLVWDMLDRPLKSKMEINWSDICSMRAMAPVNEPGILEIELIRQPMYFRETSPEPRKHTLWQQSPDFTGGEAVIWRRHQLIFSPGILEIIYEKVFQCNEYLNALSRKPFPRHESPYFNPILFKPNFSGHGANKVARYPYQANPIVLPRDPSFRATPNPATSGLNIPVTYQGEGNSNFVAPNQASRQQSFNIPTNNSGLHGTFGISPTTTNLNTIHDSPSPSSINSNNVYYQSIPPSINVNGVYDSSFPPNANINNVSFPPNTNVNNVHVPAFPPATNINNGNALGLLTDTTTDNTLDSFQLANALLEKVGPISPLLEPMESSYQQDMAFHAITGDQGNNNNHDLNGMIPDPNHWVAAQGSNGSTENVVQGANAITGDQVNNSNRDLNGMIPDPNHWLAALGSNGSTGNVVQGANAINGDQGNNSNRDLNGMILDPDLNHWLATLGSNGSTGNVVQGANAITVDQGNNSNRDLNGMILDPDLNHWLATLGSNGSTGNVVQGANAITVDQGNNSNRDLNGMIPDPDLNHWLAALGSNGSTGNVVQGANAITVDQDNNSNRDLNGMIPDPNHWLAAQGSNSSTKNVVQGANGYTFQGDMAFHAITGDQGNNSNRDLNGMNPDPNHWLAAQGFNGSTQNVVQGANGYTFQGANGNMFHVEHDNMLQGANGYMFQGTSNNMFHEHDNMNQGANGYMFKLAGNINPMRGHVRKT